MTVLARESHFIVDQAPRACVPAGADTWGLPLVPTSPGESELCLQTRHRAGGWVSCVILGDGEA